MSKEMQRLRRLLDHWHGKLTCVREITKYIGDIILEAREFIGQLEDEIIALEEEEKS